MLKPVFECITEIVCSGNISLEICTKILANIMCLLSGQRSQTLSLLQTNSMYIDDSRVFFYKINKNLNAQFSSEGTRIFSIPIRKSDMCC